MRLNTLDDELTRTIKQVAKQHLNSFQPRPKRGRRVRPSKGGEPATVTADDIRGNSYQGVPKATGTITGSMTPGFGLVHLYNVPTGPAGTVWTLQANPVTAENWMQDPIAANKPILLKKSRVLDDGTQIYIVTAEGCKPIPSE